MTGTCEPTQLFFSCNDSHYIKSMQQQFFCLWHIWCRERMAIKGSMSLKENKLIKYLAFDIGITGAKEDKISQSRIILRFHPVVIKTPLTTRSEK